MYKCNNRFTCRQTSKEIGITGKSEAGPTKFSKTHVFRVKMFDSTRRFLSQSERCEDPDLNSSPAYNRQWYQLIISSCSTKVCMS